MNKRKKMFWETEYMNNRTFIQYYNRLMELSISMFKWNNLPDTVDSRFIELCLFTDGMCLYFNDDTIGNLATRCMIGGNLDIYNIPNIRTAYSSNGYNNTLTNKDSVIIFNNLIRTNAMLDVEMFAKRLYKIDRIIDINANAQKTPILLLCGEEERLSIENIYKQYDGNSPVIFGTKGLNPKSISTLQTGAPFMCDKLYQLKTQIWNEALTYLGISNINIQKKERLITDEVMRNQGGTIASRYSRLEARRQACEQINKMFGTNITVDYREDYQVVDGEGGTETTDTPSEGGEE